MIYHINLIKNKIPDYKKRKKLFLGITFYLVICAGILVILFFTVSRNFVKTSRTRHEVVVLKNAFYSNDFYLDGKNQALNFEVIIPIVSAGDTFDTSQLIAVWKNDSLLMSAIKDIGSSTTSKKQMRGQAVLASSFLCDLKKGGL